MNKKIGILIFSPTGTTKKVCLSVAEGMGAETPLIIDITKPQTRSDLANGNLCFADLDHLIVGAPVYSGKLPLQVIESLAKVPVVKKTGATAVVVYGNRDYGVSIHTMVSLLTEAGFSVNSAGIFIGEHSYSEIVPVAVNRPDNSDLDKAFSFGEQLKSLNGSGISNIPIQLDRISRSEKYTSIKPVFEDTECSNCKLCAEACPIGIISSTGDYISAEAEKSCIGCMACVKACKHNARISKVNPMLKLAMKQIFKEASAIRKEPVTILS